MCFKDYEDFINMREVVDFPVVSDRELWSDLDSGSVITRIDVCSNESKLIGIQVTRGQQIETVP